MSHMSSLSPYRAFLPRLLCVLLLCSAPASLRGQQGDAGSASAGSERMSVGRLQLDGVSLADSVALRGLLDTRVGAPFSEELLNADMARILGYFDRSGYPFASIRLTEADLRRDGEGPLLDLTLRIDRGMLFRIHEIRVEGNSSTDTEVILRETRIDEGERYDGEKVGDIRRRLERLQFFDRVDDPQLYVRDDSVGGLLLSVVEGSTNQFDGVIGYQPARDESSGYFTGLVNLRFGNLFGTGRQLAARWEQATREASELELHYLEPWLFSFPLDLAVGFFQRQQDSAYVRRAADAELRLLATSDITVAATLQAVEVIPSLNNALPGLFRSSTYAAGLQLRIDTRDHVYNPQSGIELRNAYSGGDKSFTTAEGVEVRDFLQRIEIDAAYYRTLIDRTVFAVSLHGRQLDGDELDESDLYRLGGANTLRGYREEQFSGTRMGWINSELRYSLGRRSFAFAFFDFGYIELSPDESRGREAFTAFRNGYGIGARLETALGIMGVSYALGRGDGLADGKIHFGLINAF